MKLILFWTMDFLQIAIKLYCNLHIAINWYCNFYIAIIDIAKSKPTSQATHNQPKQAQSDSLISSSSSLSTVQVLPHGFATIDF